MKMKPETLIGLALLSALPLASAEEPALNVVAELETVTVIGTPQKAEELPSSFMVLDASMLDAARVFTTNEALRKVPGVNVRDEEGFGLRPNIGIRGLNPTRSTKVLLLEDGIPFSYAPYGDNASYYHPPVDRFDRIEVLKGAATTLYGPQTVSGVINYITPAPPQAFGAGATLTGGNHDYVNGHAYVGGRGLLLDLTRKQGDGARENTESRLNDVNAKGVFDLGGGHALTARANYYTEDSQLTYSGLTDAEYANFGRRYNPFDNDYFEAQRAGASLTHEWESGTVALRTSAYFAGFDRDWWRQSSTTSDSQCGASFTAARVAGTAVDPDSCNSIQGRLRDYRTWGVEPRLTFGYSLGGMANELSAGVRAHFESQSRLQLNGASSTARDGATAESNERLTDAYSAFVQNRFAIGNFAVTPGLRVENVNHERTNRLTGANGSASLTELIPSLGASLRLPGGLVAFAGAHRGFAPPRTEDMVSNSGTSVDLDAEESVNLELGLRGAPLKGLNFEVTGFRNDFSRQIAVGSIAGGSTPLAVGEALYQGVELGGRADLGRINGWTHSPFVDLAYTWLPTANQESAFLRVDNGTPANNSAAGKRQPYAPEHLLTTTVGYRHAAGVEARLEAVYVAEQFSDFANTEAPDGSGQIGRIGSYTIWNAALNWRLPVAGWTVFTTAKNLFDRDYIADRTRGILAGVPVQVQAGIEYRYF